MQIIIHIQPYVPVNPGSFIKPTFNLGSIDTYCYDIFLIELYKIGNIIPYSVIATHIASEIDPVNPETTLPEYPVETYLKTLSGIAGRDNEFLSVPTYTLIREIRP